MDPVSEKVDLLSQHEFFAELPPGTIRRLVAHARILNVAPGTTIFRKGDEGSGLLAVFSGTVRISVSSDTDAEMTLNLIGPGEIFGEIALLDGMPRSADATAMQRSRLLFLERRDFLAVLLDEPAAALTLLRVVSRRLRQTSQQFEQARFGPMSSQLARTLISLDAVTRSGGAPGIRMSQRAIGAMIGLSRESTNRTLRAWHHAGIIALERGGVSIRDGQALSRIATS